MKFTMLLNVKAVVCLAAFALLSCSTEEQSTDASYVETEEIEMKGKTISDEHFQTYGDDFKALVGTPKGVIRSIDLGMSVDELKKAEKSTFMEGNDNFLKYSVALNEDESAVVTYLIIDGKVQGINLMLSMKTDDEIEAMSLEFNDYFTQKYGAATITEDGDEIWKPTNKHEIDIIEKESAEGFVLEIDIS